MAFKKPKVFIKTNEVCFEALRAALALKKALPSAAL